jgi:hypothetical protein
MIPAPETEYVEVHSARTGIQAAPTKLVLLQFQFPELTEEKRLMTFAFCPDYLEALIPQMEQKIAIVRSLP